MSGIQMALLGAGGGPTFNLVTGSYSDTAFDPDTAECDWQFASDGFVTASGINSGTQANYQWIDPAPPGTTYYVRVTVTAGGFSFGASTGVWLASTTTRNWTVQQSGSGGASVTFTAEIATDSGGTNIVKTATGIQLAATVL